MEVAHLGIEPVSEGWKVALRESIEIIHRASNAHLAQAISSSRTLAVRLDSLKSFAQMWK